MCIQSTQNVIIKHKHRLGQYIIEDWGEVQRGNAQKRVVFLQFHPCITVQVKTTRTKIIVIPEARMDVQNWTRHSLPKSQNETFST